MKCQQLVEMHLVATAKHNLEGTKLLTSAKKATGSSAKQAM
jgi:hypothetical protein